MSYYCITDASSIVLYTPTNFACVNITSYSGLGQITINNYSSPNPTNPVILNTLGSALTFGNAYAPASYYLPTQGGLITWNTPNTFPGASTNFVNAVPDINYVNSSGFTFTNTFVSASSTVCITNINSPAFTITNTGVTATGNVTGSNLITSGTSGAVTCAQINSSAVEGEILLNPGNRNGSSSFLNPGNTGAIISSNMTGGNTDFDFVNIWPTYAGSQQAYGGFNFYNNGTFDGSCNLLMCVNQLGPYATAVGQLSVGNINSYGAITATGTVSGYNITATETVSGNNITAAGTVSGYNITATATLTSENLITNGSINAPNCSFIVNTDFRRILTDAVSFTIYFPFTFPNNPSITYSMYIPGYIAPGNQNSKGLPFLILTNYSLFTPGNSFAQFTLTSSNGENTDVNNVIIFIQIISNSSTLQVST